VSLLDQAPPRPSRAIGGLLWSSGAVATQALGQFAVLAVLARVLTLDDFGVATASLVIIGFARMATTEGFVGPAVTQRPGLTESHVRAAVCLALVTGGLTTAVVWVLAPSMAQFMHKPALVDVTRALAAVLVLQSLSSVSQALLLRELDFRRVALAEIVSFVCGFAAVGTGLALAGAGVWALVGAYVSQSALQTVMLVAMRPVPAPWPVSRPEAQEILTFGSGHTIARYLNYAALQADFLVVGRYLPAAALGAYGRAYQLATTPAVLLGGVVDKVIFPTLALRQADRARLAADYLRSVSLTVSLTAPIAALVVIVAPEVVRLLLGPGWDAVTLPLQILAATLTLRTGYKLSDALAKATGAVYARAWRQGIYAAAVLLGALATHQHGLPAVAAAVAAAITLNYFVMATLSLRLTGVSWGAFLGAHLSGAVLAVAAGLGTLTGASAARAAGLPGALVVAVACAGGLAGGGALAWLRPQLAVGDDVHWLLAQLRLRRRPVVADG
jgi:PST family polysaccharide transporter